MIVTALYHDATRNDLIAHIQSICVLLSSNNNDYGLR